MPFHKSIAVLAISSAAALTLVSKPGLSFRRPHLITPAHRKQKGAHNRSRQGKDTNLPNNYARSETNLPCSRVHTIKGTIPRSVVGNEFETPLLNLFVVIESWID